MARKNSKIADDNDDDDAARKNMSDNFIQEPVHTPAQIRPERTPIHTLLFVRLSKRPFIRCRYFL